MILEVWLIFKCLAIPLVFFLIYEYRTTFFDFRQQASARKTLLGDYLIKFRKLRGGKEILLGFVRMVVIR